jgi:2',3'-cyclic-nucleotide 2'-phosphodiesterase (5'-nucleotidase family)
MNIRTLLAAAVVTALASAPVFAQVSKKSTAKQDRLTVTDVKEGPRSVAFWLHLLHNSDGESQLINAGPGALVDFGGVARFKTLADNLKAFAPTYPADALPKGVMLLSSGDNFLAGPEFNASLDLPSGTPFYDAVAIDLIGYDALTLGNHDFDFGPDVLEDFLLGFPSSSPVFLSANLDFTGEAGLQALVNSGRIASSRVFTVSGEQIGVVGATTTDLPFISTPRDVIVNAVAPAVQAEIDALLAQGVNKIIVSTHLQGLSSEIALIPLLKNADVVIAGGGGELLADAGTLLVPGDTAFADGLGGSGYPRQAVDALGRTVYVVATRGDYRYIGRLIAGFDAAGEIVTVDSLSNAVRVSGVAPDAVASDPAVQAQVVDPVAASVAALASNVIAVSQVALDGTSNTVRSVETNLGSITADAMLYSATVLAPVFGTPVPDVALQNGGGIRNNNVIPSGNFTELNTFEILPFSNFVCVVPNITPARFKQIMENAVANVAGTPGGGSGTGRFAQIAGFTLKWDALGQRQITNSSGVITQQGSRVLEITLNDGTEIVKGGAVAPGARDVTIATIDFLARGGDQYSFQGAPFENLGISYQQSLLNYIENYLAGLISAQAYPVGGEQRIERVN